MIRTGRSPWARMILALKKAGLGRREIARLTGQTRRNIGLLECDPTRMPDHRTGEAIIRLQRQYFGGG